LLETSLKALCQEPDYGTWRGFRIIAADGSSIRLPISKEIEAKFGRFKANALEMILQLHVFPYLLIYVLP